jgi:hypothetical protein
MGSVDGISIVIPTYGRSSLLRVLLESIHADVQSCFFSTEVILADSSEESKRNLSDKLLVSSAPHFSLLRATSERLGTLALGMQRLILFCFLIPTSQFVRERCVRITKRFKRVRTPA